MFTVFYSYISLSPLNVDAHDEIRGTIDTLGPVPITKEEITQNAHPS